MYQQSLAYHGQRWRNKKSRGIWSWLLFIHYRSIMFSDSPITYSSRIISTSIDRKPLKATTRRSERSSWTEQLFCCKNTFCSFVLMIICQRTCVFGCVRFWSLATSFEEYMSTSELSSLYKSISASPSLSLSLYINANVSYTPNKTFIKNPYASYERVRIR